jgi:hypothetical protein
MLWPRTGHMWPVARWGLAVYCLAACQGSHVRIAPAHLLEFEGSVVTVPDMAPFAGAEVVVLTPEGDSLPVIGGTRTDSTGAFWFRVRVESKHCGEFMVLARLLDGTTA